MNRPTVSVIIPTHERAQYAIPTIRALLALPENVEVVVCDTSAKDLISPAFLNHKNNARIQLVRPGKPLSVIDNFNTALSAASGKYLTFIGDDDFVSSQIVEVAEWAEKKSIDAIKFTFPTLYFWPDFRHKTQQDEIAGTLRTSFFDGSTSRHDPSKSIIDALSNFGGGVMEMPRAYAGLISHELVDRIVGKYGALFGGVSPDIYSALLISVEANSCVNIDYPIIVPGASGASTAGLSANGKHVGGLRDNPHIKPFVNLVWDKRIPEFYSVPTVWGYSALKAVEVAGIPVANVDFSRLYIKCLIFHRIYYKQIFYSLNEFAKDAGYVLVLISLAKAAFHEGLWVADKIRLRLLNKLRPKNNVVVQISQEDTYKASLTFEGLYTNISRRLNLK